MLKLSYQDLLIEAGCDEAGRGCLAGPVFAAAVILPKGFNHPQLNDSKQVNENNRTELRAYIEENAIAFAVGICTEKEIDEINILNASFEAMHRAVNQLKLKPELLLIDGNRFKKHNEIPHNCIIKGDAKFMNIAAASILAKTYRDDFMRKIAAEYPEYKWEQNKGYPTKSHRDAILKHGHCKYHRQSFTLLPDQLKMNF